MLSVTTANANSYSQMNQSSISPNLFDPTSYLNHSQPLINGYNDPGMGYNNNFGFGFGVNEHLQQNLQSQEQPLFNFPTPPNSNNNYNGYGYQSQDFMKQDPMGLNYYDNNLMNINSMSIQNSRSITPPGNGIKAESTSPTLTTPGFRTRGIPPEEISIPSRSIEPNGVKKESSDSSSSSPKGNILSSIMPNVMNFLKFPTIMPPKEDNMNSRDRSMPPSPQPSRSRSNSPLPSGPKDSPNGVEREDYDHIYLSPTSKNEKAIDTNLPIIRQDDGSFDVYKPKFVTPSDFQRSPSKKGNMPLSPDEYLTLSLSKLKI
ncbi:hypothetical protein K502DRAFT_362668 [Neoconidiobolus thromboides FSU 785]|nr:hypothetical protein K502DRAFT_362668 [Neoconidiobolus thromboides FSU 785]